MHDANLRVRSSVRVLLLVAAGSLAAMTAMGAGPGDREGSDDSGVVRVRRGGGGDGGVEVTRSARAVRAEQAATESDETPAIAPSGSIMPDPGMTDGELVDLDPVAAGLPDAVPGEPDILPPGQTPHAEEIEFYDIGVRGKRSGRTIMLWGAEFAFVNCEIVVADGLAVGYTGAIGEIGVNPGSSSVMQFTLQCGGEITLTVQPAASGSLTTPNRPVRTITMQVP